ncbi:MAG TPA: hypothetical protein VG077_00695 [Verrucomicrobiae bacterium]|nr:hypothetical protein [Verrucomicrobiae bacterium]
MGYPTPTNGGVLIIEDILLHLAELVQNAALKKYGIELMYLTRESYAAKKRQLAEQQKNNVGGPVGDPFVERYKSLFGTMTPTPSASSNSVTLYVNDPEKRVINLEDQDADGKPLKTRS